MKLVTYSTGNVLPRVGALIDGDRLIADLEIGHVELSGGELPAFASMQILVDAGSGALDIARDVVAYVEAQKPEGSFVSASEARLHAPLPLPVQMRDFLCFEQHLLQSFRAAAELRAGMSDDPEAFMAQAEKNGQFTPPEIWYQQPVYYKCNRFAVSGPETDVEWPAYSQMMDYELELAAVVGKRGKDISADDASDHIFGYTIFNDFSARDAQTLEMPAMLGPAKGKDFDTGNVIGPCIVTADDIDPYDLTMVARVNGEEWSRGHSGSIHHTFEDMIAHVSQSETLHPGEILGSGTVGNGCGLELKKFLSPGDVVELEVEGIGVLRNRIVKP